MLVYGALGGMKNLDGVMHVVILQIEKIIIVWVIVVKRLL
jgi:hypothetical protein